MGGWVSSGPNRLFKPISQPAVLFLMHMYNDPSSINRTINTVKLRTLITKKTRF